MCAAPCIRFGRFNAFLLPSEKEESVGTSATTQPHHGAYCRVDVPSFMDGNSHYFLKTIIIRMCKLDATYILCMIVQRTEIYNI